MDSIKQQVQKGMDELNHKKISNQPLDVDFVNTWLNDYEHLWDEESFMYDAAPNPELIKISDCIAQINRYKCYFENNEKSNFFYDSYHTLSFNDSENLKVWMKKVYEECSSFVFTMSSIKEYDIRDGSLYIDDCRLKFEELQYTYFLTKLFQENIDFACEDYYEDLRLLNQ